MSGFKSRLQNRLTRHASASSPAGGDAIEGAAEAANNLNEHASTADLDSANHSSSGPPSRNANHQGSLHHQLEPSTTNDEPLIRKANTSVASARDTLPSPLPQANRPVYAVRTG